MPSAFARSIPPIVTKYGVMIGAGGFWLGIGTSTVYRHRKYFLPAPPLSQPPPDRFIHSKSIAHYMGDDPLKATFRQGRVGDCYFLSSVDAMQHHHQGKELLNSIRVEEHKIMPDGPVQKYTLYFPAGEQVELDESEIGVSQNKKFPVRGPKGIKMLELAYAKLVSLERNKDPKYAPQPYPNDGQEHSLTLVGGGMSSAALNKMLVGNERSELDVCTAYPHQLQKWMRDLAKDERNDYLLCAFTDGEGEYHRTLALPPKADGQERQIKKFYPNHSFSIRSITPEDDTVTVADPHDTARKVDTLTLHEFGNIFACVSGIKFKKQPKP